MVRYMSVCAAGMGPSAQCKHVVAVMLAIVDFVNGKPLLCELTCTDRLQTFHRPTRQHRGSPVKAQDLNVHGNEMDILFDPRPEQYKKLLWYPDFVKNICINFASSTGNQLPMLQTVKPANMYAVSLDHDYLCQSQEDLFLKTIGITDMTPEEADRIEEATIDQHKSDMWREERRKRLSASKFGPILRSKSQQAKSNLAQQIINGSVLDNKYVNHGLKYESAALNKYSEDYHVTVMKSGLVVSMQKPHLACSPDGLVGEDICVEIKCPYPQEEQSFKEYSVSSCVFSSNERLTLLTRYRAPSW